MRLSREIREGVLLPESFIWFRLFSRLAPSAFLRYTESLPCNPFICEPIVWGMEREVKRKKILTLDRQQSLLKLAGFVELIFGFLYQP
jgi:hypothetical protein